MNYVKKMCILKQIKQGFSGDGRALTGLIKIEQYGKNLAIEVSVINFAPLSSGEYYCLIADQKGRTELLPLRGKSLFNVVSDLEIFGGFCGVICFVKNGIFPIAYGTNGNHVYDWRKLLSGAVEKESGGVLRPTPTAERLADWKKESSAAAYEDSMPDQTKNIKTESPLPPNRYAQPNPPAQERVQQDKPKKEYDDESVAAENYYRREEGDERNGLEEFGDDAHAESGGEKQSEEKGANPQKDGDADGVLHPFKTDGNGYYLSVRREIEELFKKYPRDERLNGCFEFSKWVRIGGDEKAPQQLVGVIYDNLSPKYIAYALPTQTPENPPEEIAESCVFVPASHFDGQKGFFVIFQSAATGECIRPDSV